jgi:hypothetical protein
MPRLELVIAIMCVFSEAGLHKLLNSLCTKSHSSTNIGDCQEVILRKYFLTFLGLIFLQHVYKIFVFKMEIFTCRCERHYYSTVHDTRLTLIQNIYCRHNKPLCCFYKTFTIAHKIHLATKYSKYIMVLKDI